MTTILVIQENSRLSQRQEIVHHVIEMTHQSNVSQKNCMRVACECINGCWFTSNVKKWR